MKKIIKEIIPYIVIIFVVIIIRTFIITPVQVDGLSMYPTLNDNEILMLKKYDKNYKRFDIVVLKYQNEKLIKRIIGLPNEGINEIENKLNTNLKDGLSKDEVEKRRKEYGENKLEGKKKERGYPWLKKRRLKRPKLRIPKPPKRARRSGPLLSALSLS